MLMKLSSYQFELNYWNSRMLNLIFMVTRENIYRIYTKGNLKEDRKCSTKNQQHAKPLNNGGIEE